MIPSFPRCSSSAAAAALLLFAATAALCPLCPNALSLGLHHRSNNNNLEKRAPFSSWAGKRASSSSEHVDLAQLLHDLQELYALRGEEAAMAEQPQMAAKRAPFSSWAGKRAPFSSWAGKRAPFSSWAGKRAPFSSWAGKRSSEENTWMLDDEDDNEMTNKHRIKRSSDESEEMEEEDHPRQRRGANSFSAWGGKRNQLRRFTRNAPMSEGGLVPVRVLRPQRAAFSAWGG